MSSLGLLREYERRYPVAKALDTASLLDGPGGPAEMIPGQHHLRLTMYIAQAHQGVFEVVENLGRVNPKEGTIGTY